MMGKALAGKIPGVVNPVGSKIGDDWVWGLQALKVA
jgi:hypothetical protein